MIEDANHHLKKRRTSPSASPPRAVHSNHGRSFDCQNDSLYLLPPTPPSPPRLLHTVRISISNSSGVELGGGGEEKNEDDYHYDHYHVVSKGGHRRSFSNTSIIAALAALFLGPLLLWDDYPAKIEVLPLMRHVQLVWVALLHISIWPVLLVTAAISTFLAGRRTHHHNHGISTPSSSSSSSSSAAAVTAAPSSAFCLSAACHRLLCQPRSSLHYKLSLLLSLLFTGLISTQSFLQMAFPSLIWNPALWTPWGYTVYLPRDLQKELLGGCFTVDMDGERDMLTSSSLQGDNDRLLPTSTTSSSLSTSSPLLRSSIYHNHRHQPPLCLSEQQFSHLSSGTLSSHNPNDVATVLRGLTYLQTQSNGIVISALARNVKKSIPDLRRNIEGLAPLLGVHGTKLTFVVFENDSVDGTREELNRWAEEVNQSQDHVSSNNNKSNHNSRYNVDLIQCPPPNTNCKLNIIDRNEVYGGENKTSSGVGKLGDFRQIVLDHVIANYGDYSHMIVFDVDLGVSLSPLGILHTLGLMSESGDRLLAEEHVVASAATQVWPGTFGTVTSPYDLSAFRPKPTSANSKVRTLQRKFCQIMPSGDRWRNMCDAPSPMQFFMVLKNNDPMYHNGQPYEVKSAFNGIAMYPLGLIRERGKGAKYDSGKDGQQCEHIGFHQSLGDTMLVNPKWKMNLRVDKPGGPNGFNVVVKVFDSMAKRPNVTRVIAAVNLISFFVFVWAVWILSVTVKESIPSLFDYFEEMKRRSETSFLYGYWLDVAGRGAETSSSAAVQHRIVVAEEVAEEEGKWVEVRNHHNWQQCSIE